MSGCPCNGDCCSKPERHTPDHVCDEGFCEECYCAECLNCGARCYCEL